MRIIENAVCTLRYNFTMLKYSRNKAYNNHDNQIGGLPKHEQENSY